MLVSQSHLLYFNCLIAAFGEQLPPWTVVDTEPFHHCRSFYYIELSVIKKKRVLSIELVTSAHLNKLMKTGRVTDIKLCHGVCISSPYVWHSGISLVVCTITGYSPRNKKLLWGMCALTQKRSRSLCRGYSSCFTWPW